MSYGVMVAQQILVLFVKVRILVGQLPITLTLSLEYLGELRYLKGPIAQLV